MRAPEAGEGEWALDEVSPTPLCVFYYFFVFFVFNIPHLDRGVVPLMLQESLFPFLLVLPPSPIYGPVSVAE